MPQPLYHWDESPPRYPFDGRLDEPVWTEW